MKLANHIFQPNWQFKELDWNFISNEKFSGTELSFWQATGENYDYVLESQYVNGTE